MNSYEVQHWAKQVVKKRLRFRDDDYAFAGFPEVEAASKEDRSAVFGLTLLLMKTIREALE
ncbi:hypothetical protein HMPREF9336_04189 [Segniliparus rugosus ATCC BAA-974]|uniref:Uncharacterized protein n=1 Tax=Segniliparus rugosus (strain ATCC BAA-974 / DSM 45345 / CCUG 50838 / CIP 108380 / JCM 13579 / CDC 945) TaxID=679197 RepID=U1N906_SEGRC|nr:hypothetical protein HMPREF9336_04189 [Segniliparus rugosus ATCC BAA-974]